VGLPWRRVLPTRQGRLLRPAGDAWTAGPDPPTGCPAGRLQRLAPAASLPQLAQGQLLELITEWLRSERQQEQAVGVAKPLEYDPALEGSVSGFSYVFNNGWVPGTMSSSVKLATNAVMRG